MVLVENSSEDVDRENDEDGEDGEDGEERSTHRKKEKEKENFSLGPSTSGPSITPSIILVSLSRASIAPCIV